MLFLLVDSLLLLIVTLCMGVLTHQFLERVFNISKRSELLAIFLLGLVTTTVYFNIWSFWKPVNYFSLIPLTIVCLLSAFFLHSKLHELLDGFIRNLRLLFIPSHLPVTLCFAAVLFYYWIIPPGNVDSPNYHYLAILWYEKYKVVPGLANVHSAYAYNPAAFILQSPWSFTGLIGQSLYPLNGVVLGLFFSWLLLRSFRASHPGIAAVYLITMLLLFTPLLQNISAPSSDSLVAVCLAWPILRILELLLLEELSLSTVLIPLLVLLYAPVAKLSSFYILPILPLVFFFLPRRERKWSILPKITVIAFFIYIPWMARNYIMTGYPAYFYDGLNFFHPDWQVSPNLLRLQKYLTCVETKISSDDVTFSTPLPLSRWFLPWINAFFVNKTPQNVFFFFAGMLSFLYWLLPGSLRKTRPFLLWLFVYAGVWAWFISAPALRFGAVPLTLSIVIPLITWFSTLPIPRPASATPFRFSPRTCRLLLTLLFACAGFYYIRSGSRKPTTYAFSLKDCWLFPLKDVLYKDKGGEERKNSFPYRTLNSGIKLYIADENHICIDTDLPCMGINYGEIEMRGPRIEDGFRMKKDEIPTRFPCIR